MLIDRCEKRIKGTHVRCGLPLDHMPPCAADRVSWMLAPLSLPLVEVPVLPDKPPLSPLDVLEELRIRIGARLDTFKSAAAHRERITPEVEALRRIQAIRLDELEVVLEILDAYALAVEEGLEG